MSDPTTAVITFDEIFSWLFNPVEKPKCDERVIAELPMHLIEDNAIHKLEEYCKKHKLPLDIQNLKENVISIKVKV
ncbi:hypothetical protein [Acinetobacter baumannii]|uniref:hypothetical protein n=1 Tax=Acinetobacter baumannii TaxID=470 RepID=UPI001F167F7E|nr:hypothetical protein [Acinetobacter baumannii]MCF1300050.1 hypothetical protein [Acinetobacter baumannii]HAV4522642.1 hypothetical protein [Acinetobacter baumannii]HAV4563999.1 hypothetical protein [Acinetobacter baumannii]